LKEKLNMLWVGQVLHLIKQFLILI
jgi:hypothetical protein